MDNSIIDNFFGLNNETKTLSKTNKTIKPITTAKTTTAAKLAPPFNVIAYKPNVIPTIIPII